MSESYIFKTMFKPASSLMSGFNNKKFNFMVAKKADSCTLKSEYVHAAAEKSSVAVNYVNRWGSGYNCKYSTDGKLSLDTSRNYTVGRREQNKWGLKLGTTIDTFSGDMKGAFKNAERHTSIYANLNSRIVGELGVDYLPGTGQSQQKLNVGGGVCLSFLMDLDKDLEFRVGFSGSYDIKTKERTSQIGIDLDNDKAFIGVIAATNMKKFQASMMKKVSDSLSVGGRFISSKTEDGRSNQYAVAARYNVSDYTWRGMFDTECGVQLSLTKKGGDMNAVVGIALKPSTRSSSAGFTLSVD